MRYQEQTIGTNTGKIWNYLRENPKSSLRKIVRETNLAKNDVLLAIGWLFKEDKVATEQTKREIFFYLK